MRLKARYGQGATQTLAGNANAANAKETAQERELELAAEWFCAAMREAVLRERLERERAATEHQGVSSGRKRRGGRLARCVSRRGAGDKESFTGGGAARVARPRAKAGC
jgi:hypothetical protein